MLVQMLIKLFKNKTLTNLNESLDLKFNWLPANAMD